MIQAKPSAVTRLIVHGRETVERENPGWVDVEQAVRQMNGDTVNQVIAVVTEGHYLLVGGGDHNQFVCQAELPDGQWMLCDPTRSDKQVISVMNGQPGDYVATHVLGIDTIKEAARYFHETGKLLPSLNWQRV